uniref:Small ribosomal subunit protein uS10m n=1 Tax=Simocephalus serrulatus TaxID=117539 RepID=A0A4Y7NMV5_9CRUS|nr:EOG090X0GP9 [Simocephalus serrulatus]SVE94580.1 EOG090X0GP9 [Simocephalus serrulatus]
MTSKLVPTCYNMCFQAIKTSKGLPITSTMNSTHGFRNMNSLSLVPSNAEDVLYRNIEIEMRSGEPAVLLSFEWFACHAAQNLGIKLGKCWAPPKPHHNRLTLLKSIHIYKKHRVQYEVRTYFRYVTVEKLTGSTAQTFLEYIQRNVPEGVAIKVSKRALERLPTSLIQVRK